MTINPVTMWNFDAAKAAVVEKVNILRACAFAAETQGEVGQRIIHDLIVPNMQLLAQFCENVKLDDSPGPMATAKTKPMPVNWRAVLSAKNRLDVFHAIGMTGNRELAERWRERAREELHRVALDPEDTESAWWECTLEIRGIVELEILLSATRERTIGVDLYCYTPNGTAKLGDYDSRYWTGAPEGNENA